MKKTSTILAALSLFTITLFLAFQQGKIGFDVSGALVNLEPVEFSPLLYSGIQAAVVGFFIQIIGALMTFFSGSLLVSIMALALLVELILLYPSVSIQLKQKKIHLFHKKLVDRFRSGELSLGKAKHELGVLYTVNEQMHGRGALLFLVQIIVFLSVLWSLNAFSVAYAFTGFGQTLLNASLLAKPVNFLLPLFVGLTYFFHSMSKIYLKQKEDHISVTQSHIAILIGMVGATTAFFFSQFFPSLLSIYFATLITFSTLRYLIVEQNEQSWGKAAQRSLIKTIRSAEKNHSFLADLSAKWNNFAFVRHSNFHLLEEAASMSLMLMIVLNAL